MIFFILGANCTDENRIDYVIEYKDNWPNRVFSSHEAVEKFPNLVLQFLEAHIAMIGAKKRVSFVAVEETFDLIGEPIDVTCKYFNTNFEENIVFVCLFN